MERADLKKEYESWEFLMSKPGAEGGDP